MKEYFDEEFSELLQKSEFVLPDSYEKRFNDTLDKISNYRRKRYFLLFHSKIAAVIALSVVSLSMSIGVGATINMYMQRMNSLSEKEVAEYNYEVQNTDKEADSFSRQLSELENNKLSNLREEYETKGRFPTKEIPRVEKQTEVIYGELCFCVEESKFYLPEQELSDDEILQIIDFMEKRDYSVRKENAITELPTSENEKVDENEAVELAKVIVERMYLVNTTNANTKVEFDTTQNSAGENLSSYFVSLSNEGWMFDASVEIDSETGILNGIDIVNKSKEACVPGIETNVDEYKEYASEVERLYESISSGKSIENIWFSYNYLTDGTLNRGNVKYVVELEDGSGYVFMYSVNINMVYDIYMIPDIEQYKKQEKQKQKMNKKNGIYREVVDL